MKDDHHSIRATATILRLSLRLATEPRHALIQLRAQLTRSMSISNDPHTNSLPKVLTRQHSPPPCLPADPSDTDGAHSSGGGSTTSSSSGRSPDAAALAALPGLPPAPEVSSTPDFIPEAEARGAPEVLSLEPETLLDVANSCVAIAQACGEAERGRALCHAFIGQLQAISRAVAQPNGALPPSPTRRGPL